MIVHWIHCLGNRWILPIWTKTPHKQPPLDLTELSEEFIPEKQPYYEYPAYPDNYTDFEESRPIEYLELQQHQQLQQHQRSKESDL